MANLEPLVLDWERVGSVRVKVEKGTLRFRFGTTAAKKNLNFVAGDKRSGPPWFPGKPEFWPADYTAQAGDPDKESFIMPLERAMDCFGFWYAPLEEEDLVGFSLSKERTRIAQFWGGYKMPKGDGTMHPPMNLIGPPRHMPYVAITLLDRQMRPLKDEEGREIVIRPREFFNFDDMSQYEEDPAAVASQVSFLEGLSRDELEALRELVKERQSRRAKTA
jgi:hypothetical protein